MKYGIIILAALFALACAGSNKSAEPVVEAELEPIAVQEVQADTTIVAVFIRSMAPVVTEFIFDSTTVGWRGYVNYYQNRRDSLTFQQKLVLTPKADWEEFDLMVNYLRLFDLPPQNEIPGYKGPQPNPNRIFVDFYLKRNDDLVRYTYEHPEAESSNYWESGNVITFASYLSTEFTVTVQQIPSPTDGEQN